MIVAVTFEHGWTVTEARRMLVRDENGGHRAAKNLEEVMDQHNRDRLSKTIVFPEMILYRRERLNQSIEHYVAPITFARIEMDESLIVVLESVDVVEGIRLALEVMGRRWR